MNQGFFSLEKEKQIKIINAGFQVFAQNEYSKAPVAEIAVAAGISKSLLFYHFKNKKELYLFLWDKAIELTKMYMKESNTLETTDFFEMIRRSLRGKCALMMEYPYVSEFLIRAYNESNEDVSRDIQTSFHLLDIHSEKKIWESVDLSNIRPDIDVHDLYREIIWASDGYMHMVVMQKTLNAEQIMVDFEKLISMWKTVYGRSE